MLRQSGNTMTSFLHHFNETEVCMLEQLNLVSWVLGFTLLEYLRNVHIHTFLRLKARQHKGCILLIGLLLLCQGESRGHNYIVALGLWFGSLR